MSISKNTIVSVITSYDGGIKSYSYIIISHREQMVKTNLLLRHTPTNKCRDRNLLLKIFPHCWKFNTILLQITKSPPIDLL